MSATSPASPGKPRRPLMPGWIKTLLILAGLGLLAFTIMLFIASPTRVPEGLQPVVNFEADRYLGKWYEVIRLDHSFERGLQNVTAEYSLNDDGSIRVLNRGYNTRQGEWEETEGKAQFVGDPTVGSLKVSFFGPFYGGYHVIALDRDYGYAMLTGPSRKYLWILSRENTLPEEVTQGLLHQAKVWGFDTTKAIRVNHTPPELMPKRGQPAPENGSDARQ
jgi:apolipoprotein D and lipocalin family protein